MKTILIDLVKTRMLDWCSIHGVAIYDLYVDYLRYNRRGEPRVFLNNEGGVNSIFEDYDAFSIIQIAKALDIESIGDMRANAFIGYDANGNVKCEDDLSYFVNTQEIAEWFVNNANNFEEYENIWDVANDQIYDNIYNVFAAMYELNPDMVWDWIEEDRIHIRQFFVTSWRDLRNQFIQWQSQNSNN